MKVKLPEQNIKIKQAFSLLELSIVILIASILITGALTFSTAGTDQAKIEATKQKMEVIYKAIGNFVAANGMLPCPASLLQIKSSSTTYGTEASATNGSCSATGVYQSGTGSSIYAGMVPVQALGLSNDFAEDGFGSKIVYAVNQNLTNSGVSGFGSATVAGNKIDIQTISSGGTIIDVTNDGAFILISYGKNQSGAWNANSNSANPTSSDIDEVENIISTTIANNDNEFTIASQRSDIFDDITFYKTRNQLVVDYNLFDDVLCPSETAQVLSVAPFGNSYSFSWNPARYGEVAASITPCTSAGAAFNKGPTYPTRRCEALGVWGPVINNCLN